MRISDWSSDVCSSDLGTPVNADVATTRIDLLLYQRRFAAARAMAEQYADTFTTGPAAIEMAFARAKVEWLAGKTGDARNLYRAAVGRLNQAGTDIDAYDRLRLGRAYARLGDEKTAMQELAAATADKRMSRGRSEEHTSELQSLMRISYAVFCLKKN